MNVLVHTGQVEAHEAQVTLLVARPATPPVGWQPESRPEWFSKGGRIFLSANKTTLGGLENPISVTEDGQSLEDNSEEDGV